MVPAYGMVLGLPMATHIYTISTSPEHTFFHSEFICYNSPCSFILPQAAGIIVTIGSKKRLFPCNMISAIKLHRDTGGNQQTGNA
jgi:hypothetical protein